jgi:hypothetical protein
MTFEERIAWILENRKLGQREWSLSAGLSKGYVSVLLTRLRRRPEQGPGEAEDLGRLDYDTIQKLATAANVSGTWLATGAGRPEVEEAAPVPGGVPLYRNHPRWPEFVQEARRLRPTLRPATFDKLADMEFVWGPIDRLDATLLADIARGVEDWEARTKA